VRTQLAGDLKKNFLLAQFQRNEAKNAPMCNLICTNSLNDRLLFILGFLCTNIFASSYLVKYLRIVTKKNDTNAKTLKNGALFRLLHTKSTMPKRQLDQEFKDMKLSDLCTMANEVTEQKCSHCILRVKNDQPLRKDVVITDCGKMRTFLVNVEAENVSLKSFPIGCRHNGVWQQQLANALGMEIEPPPTIDFNTTVQVNDDGSVSDETIEFIRAEILQCFENFRKQTFDNE
jgi:hypothetical protein